MNRREFLATAAVAAAAAPTLAAEKEMPILDTHQHLWDLKKFTLPWVKKGDALDRDYLMSDYLEATKGLNVVKTIYMEVDVEPAQQQAEAEWVIEVCKSGKTPLVAGVVSGRPASDGFAKYAAPFKDSPYIKGLRQVLHGPATPAGYCLDDRFVKSIRLLGELGLRFDLCMRAAELPDAAKLIDACPDTRFILDHCGNANVQARDRTQWKKDIAEVAKRKSVVCKVSGIVASATPGQWKPDDLAPIVNHTLEVFGPERVMFGGDWPVCTRAASFAQWVSALKEIVRERKEAEQRKLFHDNAVRIYGLRS